MMKLNNRGWGLGTMLGFIIFFVAVLLIVAIISYNFGIDKGSPQQKENNVFTVPE
mgnify:CR=1 FL=1